jgi:hypothetical protein
VRLSTRPRANIISAALPDIARALAANICANSPRLTETQRGSRVCAPAIARARARVLAPALIEGLLLFSDTAWLLASSECAPCIGGTRGG